MHAWRVFVLVLVTSLQLAAAATTPNWLELSWLFDWTAPGESYPVPTTSQCETLHIKWSRRSATGPDGVAPYFLQIYTSNFIFPFIIPAGSSPETDLTIPFSPGTQYEICMFDSNNSTGGCQAVYSVTPNITTSTPTCANFSMPAKALNVTSEYANGKLSQFGWVNSCSDIRVTPQEGTPPFTFTVAPALRPPLNITSNDMSPINWTVALSWGSPFFISLVDSKGLSWSNGPIHSGDGDTACLSYSDRRSSVSTSVASGAVVAGIVLGALLALLAARLISQRQKSRSYSLETDKKITPFTPVDASNLESQRGHGARNHRIIPIPIPLPLPRKGSLPVSGTVTQTSSDQSGTVSSNVVAAAQQSSNGGNTAHGRNASEASTTSGSQVYLIHHDSGRAPVSVITSHGTQVVELPPGYSSNYSPAAFGDGRQRVATTQLEGSSARASESDARP